jgi:hypothetical protein
MLFTAILAEEPLGEAGALFLENEFGQADVNKFTALAFATDHVKSLDAATSDDRTTSARYVDVMAPLGLGDELRAALVSAGRCWGVLCLHRSDRPTGFGVAEIALVRRLVPHLAEGLRRAIVAPAAVAPQPTVRGPGVIVLDENLSITSTNAEAEQWMADLYDARWMDAGTGALPAAIYAAAAQAAPVRRGPKRDSGRHAPADPQRCLASRSRKPACWADRPTNSSCRGERSTDADGIAVPRRATAHPRPKTRYFPRLAGPFDQGDRQRAAHLRYTVQDHLSSVFDKFGVGSRRELVAALLGPPT